MYVPVSGAMMNSVTWLPVSCIEDASVLKFKCSKIVG